MSRPPAGRRFDLIAMGRAAVDLYGEQIGGRLEDMSSFAKYMGGSAANTAYGLARLAHKPAMLTRVGDEHMGRFVRETLAEAGVDVSHVRTDKDRLTGLVILGVKDRDTFPLIFFRENCADMAVSEEDFDADFVGSARVFLTNGTHFSAPETAQAVKTALGYARAAGTKTVFDVDYRPVLWGLAAKGRGEDRFVRSDAVSAHLQALLPMFDVVVGTEEEIHICGGATETLAALRNIRARTPATIVLKLGPKGAMVFEGAIPATLADGAFAPGAPVETFNTLGAGDAFMAGLMSGWLDGLPWVDAAKRGNACGAIVVSRHGCAPACPTRAELDWYLAHKKDVFRLHADTAFEILHRKQTRRRDWPLVMALAFDHRIQLEKMVDAAGAPRARLHRLKDLLADVVLDVAKDTKGAGVLCDDRWGEAALWKMSGKGLWIGRPVEAPGVFPLDLQHGPDPALVMRAWPEEHVVKCLMFWHPDDLPEERAAQEAILAKATRAAQGTGHEMLIEVIASRGRPSWPDAVPAAMKRLYDIGLEPEWWKLPPPVSSQDWDRLETLIDERDPLCRGVLLLGLDASEAEIAAGFKLARGRKWAKGFAVGRTAFAKPAQAWLENALDDAGLVRDVAAAYRRLIAAWRG
ncbi:MAG: 5-dehydro-2-deoxygluconokinase [Tagaea sp.]